MQKDRQDKTAAGWDHVEKVEKHESQVDHSKVYSTYGMEVPEKLKYEETIEII